jgi:hypothetical protein
VLTTGYMPVKKVAVRVIDGEAVMLTIADSKLHRLNRVATRIWQGVEAGESVPEIVSAIVAGFGAPREQVEADVEALLADLTRLGIVEPAAGPAERSQQ